MMSESTLRDHLLEALGQIEEVLEKEFPDEPIIPPSPWRSLFFGGGEGGGLYVLGCPPGEARKALASGLAAEFLKTTNSASSLAWFSLREPAVEATIRLLSLSAGFSPVAVMRGQVRSRRNLHQLSTTAARLAECPVFIEDSSNLSISDVTERCRAWKETHGCCGPILIDGVESLLADDERAGDSNHEGLEKIADDLCHLAWEFEAPVIVLATLDTATPIKTFAAPWQEHADLIATLEAGAPDPKTGGAAATLRFLKPDRDSDSLVTPIIFRSFLMCFDDLESDESDG